MEKELSKQQTYRTEKIRNEMADEVAEVEVEEEEEVK